MIRQAIACDICGAEKKQTNHWFIAMEQAGELRISSWSSERKGRSGAKHLCGQTCLHRLVDDFLAGTLGGTLSGRQPGGPDEERSAALSSTAASVATPAAAKAATPAVSYLSEATRESSYEAAETDEFESSARLIPTPPTRPAQPLRAAQPARITEAPDRQVAVATMAPRLMPPASLPSSARPGTPPELPPAAVHSNAPVSSITRPAMQMAPPSRDSAAIAANILGEISPQRRRSEAWERERAREAASGDRNTHLPAVHRAY